MIAISKDKSNRGNTVIRAEGHAENRIVCAMYTALTVSLVMNLTGRLKLHPTYELEDGHFVLYTDGLSEEGMELVNAYLYSIRQLKISYPHSFTLRY